METDVNGCSTCPNGHENFEPFFVGYREYVQYEYRTLGGELFSCIAKTLGQAQMKRDLWLAKHNFI